MCGRYVSPDAAALERMWQIDRRWCCCFPRKLFQTEMFSIAVPADKMPQTLVQLRAQNDLPGF